MGPADSRLGIALHSRSPGFTGVRHTVLRLLGLALCLALGVGAGAGTARALSVPSQSGWHFEKSDHSGWFHDATPSRDWSSLSGLWLDHVFPPGCGIASWAPGCDHATQKTEHADLPWFWKTFPGPGHGHEFFHKPGKDCSKPPSPPPVPEPGTLALLALGLGGLLVGGRRRLAS